MSHIPVLLNEMLEYLSPGGGKTYIDGTFGAGGYTRAILKSANCNVISIDQDPGVVKFADSVKGEFGDRFDFWAGNFSNIKELLEQNNNGTLVDGVVVDLGVSSMQLDQGDRGFSFAKDAPLDMRMSQSGKSAADIVNNSTEEELADIIYYFGEERSARKIARDIIEARKEKEITTTSELANIVRKAIGFRKSKIDLATKTFQAIRIAVNDEMGVLDKFLEDVGSCLAPGGRLVVVTFHSLEDSRVKYFLKSKAKKKVAKSKYAKKEEVIEEGVEYELLTYKAVSPLRGEVVANPRSRSAKLRAAVKLGSVIKRGEG